MRNSTHFIRYLPVWAPNELIHYGSKNIYTQYLHIYSRHISLPLLPQLLPPHENSTLTTILFAMVWVQQATQHGDKRTFRQPSSTLLPSGMSVAREGHSTKQVSNTMWGQGQLHTLGPHASPSHIPPNYSISYQEGSRKGRQRGVLFWSLNIHQVHMHVRKKQIYNET